MSQTTDTKFKFSVSSKDTNLSAEMKFYPELNLNASFLSLFLRSNTSRYN